MKPGEVLAMHFPTMKPLDSDKKVSKEVSAPAAAAQAAPEASEKIDFSNVEIEPLFKDFVDFDTFAKSDYRAVKVKECEAVRKSKKLLKFVLDDGTGVDRVILSGIHDYYEPEELVGKACIAITNLPPRAMMGIDSCGMLINRSSPLMRIWRQVFSTIFAICSRPHKNRKHFAQMFSSQIRNFYLWLVCRLIRNNV